jgi:hypothetical protein
VGIGEGEVEGFEVTGEGGAVEEGRGGAVLLEAGAEAEVERGRVGKGDGEVFVGGGSGGDEVGKVELLGWVREGECGGGPIPP